MNTVVSPVVDAGEDSHLHSIVEEVSHYLPSQAPIRRFVHHNTLHHFEDLPFHDAVRKAHEVFDCHPYPTEAFFDEQVKRGRVGEDEVDAVLSTEKGPKLPFHDWSRRDFRLFRLRHLFAVPEIAQIRYRIDEGEVLYECEPGVPEECKEYLAKSGDLNKELTALWELMLEQAVCEAPSEELAGALRWDSVNAMMIRFCGAYLDQGISYWPMPQRDGLYSAFLALYSQSGVPLPPGFGGLVDRLRRQAAEGWNSLRALQDGLNELGIPVEGAFEALRDRGLSLKGWAGMVSTLEHRPDLAPGLAPPVSLLDFFAIHLQLEVAAKETGAASKENRRQLRPDYQLAYEAFCLAQYAGLKASDFQGSEAVKTWLREVRDFDEISRREVMLEAYEKRYREEILDGLKAHLEAGITPPVAQPRFQSVFCIDDREESTRRHLEEVCPEMETFGYAGFFGIPMAYQGLTDPHSVPLCPPVITPKHLVREYLADGRISGGKKAIGGARQTWRASRNSFVRGGVLSAVTGILAGIPLVGQTLMPGLFHSVGQKVESALDSDYVTRLKIEREEGEPPNDHGYYEGFTVDEMAGIVKGALLTMGISRFAPLLLMVGHGSSSLNNPHEAAHDCGATGGGRGGPNARAFAAMANHPKVREKLKEAGLVIPESTWVVGAYHNTCDDSMTYYDLDLVPGELRSELQAAEDYLRKGCVLDAHERCRRFENMPLSITPEKAYTSVQARAVTLAQTRPEYGHSTNSICIVGRRERTRGLFLDRRAFLVSYDPTTDPSGEILGNLLQSVGPVGAGINLEYYFSTIDASGYGCGTKLPHNVSGLLGVMDGHSSDLRTGLPWQMVDIHEPMRLLNIVEAFPEQIMLVLNSRPGLKALIDRAWIQVVAWSPEGSDLWVYHNGKFEPYVAKDDHLTVSATSVDYYKGHREHLAPARILAGLRKAAE